MLRDFNHLTLDYLAHVDYGNGVEGREGNGLLGCTVLTYSLDDFTHLLCAI